MWEWTKGTEMNPMEGEERGVEEEEEDEVKTEDERKVEH